MPDPSVTIRPPSPDDAGAVSDLINAADLVDYGEIDTTVDDLVEEWQVVDLARNAWIATEPDGRVIGYADLQPRGSVRLRLYLVVHPDRRRRGIGEELLTRAEARGRELVAEAPAGTRVWLEGFGPGGREIERKLAGKHGFEHARTYWRMVIEMSEPPPPAVLPDGVVIRTYDPQHDERAVFDAVEDSFADHWNHVPMSLDEWLAATRRPDFDPTLWLLAVDGNQIIGTSLCRVQGEMGWVGTLGVRRPWRRRGLARALLLRTFAEWWRRGERRVGLGVDSSSLTGATRLYESVGMRVSERYDQYVKVLREGVDLATRELRD